MMAMLRNFLSKLYDEFAEIRFAAASLAFSSLLSIIPFLIVILAFFQSVGGFDSLYPQAEAVLLSYLKEATGSTVTQYLKATITQVQSRTIGATGILFLIFTSLGLLRNIDIAFQRIWRLKVQRPFHRRMGMYWFFLISAPVLLAVFIGLRSIDYMNSLSRAVEHQFAFSVWTSFVLWILYTVIPDTKVNRIASLIAAIAASAALTIVQGSFLWASLKIFKQNKFYGSLASMPIFLIWILIVWWVVLSGVSLCSFLQQRVIKRPTNIKTS